MEKRTLILPLKNLQSISYSQMGAWLGVTKTQAQRAWLSYADARRIHPDDDRCLEKIRPFLREEKKKLEDSIDKLQIRLDYLAQVCVAPALDDDFSRVDGEVKVNRYGVMDGAK